MRIKSVVLITLIMIFAAGLAFSGETRYTSLETIGPIRSYDEKKHFKF